MDEIKKMFRVLVNGQSAMKAELLAEIRKVREELAAHRDENKADFKKVNNRIDVLGRQLAELDSLPAMP